MVQTDQAPLRFIFLQTAKGEAAQASDFLVAKDRLHDHLPLLVDRSDILGFGFSRIQATFAREDVAIRDITISLGDVVVVVIGSANHDETLSRSGSV